MNCDKFGPPLSDLSLEAATHFLEFDKRIRLARSNRRFRAIEKNIPFLIRNAEIEEDNWSLFHFVGSKYSKLSYCLDSFKYSNTSIKQNIGIESVTNEGYEFLTKVLKRPGTLIENLSIKNATSPLPFTAANQIRCLKLEYFDCYTCPIGLLSSFGETKIGKVKVRIGSRGDNLLDELRLLKMDSLEISADYIPEQIIPRFLTVQTGTLQIVERKSDLAHYLFSCFIITNTEDVQFNQLLYTTSAILLPRIIYFLDWSFYRPHILGPSILDEMYQLDFQCLGYLYSSFLFAVNKRGLPISSVEIERKKRSFEVMQIVDLLLIAFALYSIIMYLFSGFH